MMLDSLSGVLHTPPPLFTTSPPPLPPPHEQPAVSFNSPKDECMDVGHGSDAVHASDAARGCSARKSEPALRRDSVPGFPWTHTGGTASGARQGHGGGSKDKRRATRTRRTTRTRRQKHIALMQLRNGQGHGGGSTLHSCSYVIVPVSIHCPASSALRRHDRRSLPPPPLHSP